MSFQVEADQVVIRLPWDEFNRLMYVLGHAEGYARKMQNERLANMVRHVMNRVNEGNAQFTPYEVKAVEPI